MLTVNDKKLSTRKEVQEYFEAMPENTEVTFSNKFRRVIVAKYFPDHYGCKFRVGSGVNELGFSEFTMVLEEQVIDWIYNFFGYEKPFVPELLFANGPNFSSVNNELEIGKTYNSVYHYISDLPIGWVGKFILNLNEYELVVFIDRTSNTETYNILFLKTVNNNVVYSESWHSRTGVELAADLVFTHLFSDLDDCVCWSR